VERASNEKQTTPFARAIWHATRTGLLVGAILCAAALGIFMLRGGWRMDGSAEAVLRSAVAYLIAGGAGGALYGLTPNARKNPLGRNLVLVGMAALASLSFTVSMFGLPWDWDGRHLFTVVGGTVFFTVVLRMNWYVISGES
jgi:hypothetical protein